MMKRVRATNLRKKGLKNRMSPGSMRLKMTMIRRIEEGIILFKVKTRASKWKKHSTPK
jgi:hypothetical protein